MARVLFIAAFLVLPGLVFLVLVLLRRARMRRLAALLGARWEGTGWLAPGAIVGPGLRIEAEQVGKSYRTSVSLRAGPGSGRFLLRPGFFREGLDWSCAFVPAVRKERAFLWEIELPGWAQPSREQQAELMAGLPGLARPAGLQAELEAARVRELSVADGTISTSLRGIVSDPARIQCIVQVLRRIAPASSADARAA